MDRSKTKVEVIKPLVTGSRSVLLHMARDRKTGSSITKFLVSKLCSACKIIMPRNKM